MEWIDTTLFVLKSVVEALNRNAGAIQALGSIAVAVLTFVLIRVTDHYAKTTDQYAETAERQLKESILTREASLCPYIHVTSMHFNTTDSRDREVLAVIGMVNAGIGPALSVAGRLFTSKATFDIIDDPPTVIVPGEGARKLFLRASPAVMPRDLPSLVGSPALLKATCRDLLDHWWVTEVPIQIVADSENSQKCPMIVILDWDERVSRDSHREVSANPFHSL